MRAWSTAFLGASSRQTAVRVALGVALVGILVWALPVRRAGDSGGHHAAHETTLDLFDRAGVTELKEGQRGPAFRLATLDGRSVALDEWREKLVVLNFWATWCQPCTVEMPSLERLWTRYRDRGLVVVGISVDRGAPRTLLDPYVQGLRLSFPILLDPQLETAGQWRITALPATFIIKPGGDVAGIVVGPRDWASAPMTALLESLLPPHRHAGS